MTASDHLSPGQFFHGTRAELQPGALVDPERESADSLAERADELADDPGSRYAYFASSMRAAKGFGSRVYQVEPTGHVEADPFEGEWQGQYRSRHPLRVVGEV